MTEPNFSDLVGVLLAEQADHVYADTTTCRCGYKPADIRDWRWHVAGNQVEALLRKLAGGDSD